MKRIGEVLDNSFAKEKKIITPPDPWQCPHCGKVNYPTKVEAPEWMSRDYFYFPVKFCSCPEGQRQKEEYEKEKARQEWLAKASSLISELQNRRWGRYRFDNWDKSRSGGKAAKWLEVVDDYVENVNRTGKNWLYLYGTYGTGKTHLGVAATRKIAAKRLWKPNIVVWVELCNITKESWGSDSAFNEYAEWQSARKAGILFIDDLDKLPAEKWAMGKLLAMINYRADNMLPTIITANHSLLDLQNKWANDDVGLAVISRIGGQLSHVVEMKGEDSRWL